MASGNDCRVWPHLPPKLCTPSPNPFKVRQFQTRGFWCLFVSTNATNGLCTIILEGDRKCRTASAAWLTKATVYGIELFKESRLEGLAVANCVCVCVCVWGGGVSPHWVYCFICAICEQPLLGQPSVQITEPAWLWNLTLTTGQSGYISIKSTLKKTVQFWPKHPNSWNALEWKRKKI